jgi:hypothetical protein
VRFPLGETAGAFVEGATARLVIEHTHYRATADLAPEVQASLAEDLRES